VNVADEELVVAAQNGDRRAFEILVERHKRRAYQIAFGFARDREEAKDLSQEAFLRAFARLPSFDGRSSFYTWFYRILVNLCLDYARRKNRDPVQEFDENAERRMEPSLVPSVPVLPDARALAEQISRKAGAALEALPAKQRTAFILKNHHGLSIKEIAETMQTAEGTVKTHLHRAVTFLRERLAEFA